MPHFDWKTSALTLIAVPVIVYVFRRVRTFAKRSVGKVMDAAFWVAERFVADSIAYRMSLKRYCAVQLEKEKTRTLPVPGSRGVALETDHAFIPLRLEGADRRAVSPPSGLWDGGRKRAQIVGDPGSGKSSLIKKLFRTYCISALHGSHVPVPVLIELKSLKPGRLRSDEKSAEWLMGQIRSQFEEVHGYNMRQLFDSTISDRGILVLLDGLDEVSSESYKAVVRAINGLHRTLENLSSKNLMIVTMRSQFHNEVREDLEETFPSVFRVQPFSPTDTFNFLVNWPFAEPDKSRTEVNRIFAELADRPTLREMCSNPLVLAMYVAQDQSGLDSGAPDTRTAFYVQVVEELLVARRSRQIGVTAKTALREQREKVLGRLALSNLLDGGQPANSVRWSEAVKLTREICKSSSDAAAKADFRQICNDTGILVQEREEESLSFIHLTFCEFLAAKEVAQGSKSSWQMLINAHTQFAALGKQSRSRLVEVLPFVLGLLPRGERFNALGKVWELGDQPVMGRCFLETQGYDHPLWRDYVRTESNEILDTPLSAWDESWFRRLHLFSVVLADENEWVSLYNQIPTLTLEDLFSQIVQSDKDRLVSVFASYASFDPHAAFRVAKACGVDLVRDHPHLVVDLMDSPPFLEMMLEIMQDDVSNADWHNILAEAAFAGGATPHVLAALEWDYVSTPDKLLPSRLPTRSRWFIPLRRRTNGIEGFLLCLSLLTYSQTVAITAQRAGRVDYRVFPRVDLMGRYSSPNARLFSRLTGIPRVLKFIAILLLCVVVTLAVRPFVHGKEVAPLVAAVVLSMLMVDLYRIIEILPQRCARIYALAMLDPAALEVRTSKLSPLWRGPRWTWMIPVAVVFLPTYLAAEALCRDVFDASEAIRNLEVTIRSAGPQAEAAAVSKIDKS